MAGQRARLLVFLLSWLPLLEGAKILTLSLFGGSHYLLMDRVAQILQDHGHDVTFLQPSGLKFISGFKVEKKYQIVLWFPPEDYEQEYKEHLDFFLNEGLLGRDSFTNLLKLMKLHATQCSHLLRRTDIMGPLKNESFDLVVVDGTDGGALLIAEKLGRPWVAMLPVTFGALSFGLPEPVSYVPAFYSSLTDRMGFWGRVRNSLMFFVSTWSEWSISAQFDDLIREHFPEDSKPELFHLRQKAELWFVNSDFAFEFARPLLPNTVYIGGLTDKPVEPLPPVSKTLVLGHNGNVGLSFQEIAKRLYKVIVQFLCGTKQRPRVSVTPQPTLDVVGLFISALLVRAKWHLQFQCAFPMLSHDVTQFFIC